MTTIMKGKEVAIALKEKIKAGLLNLKKKEKLLLVVLLELEIEVIL